MRVPVAEDLDQAITSAAAAMAYVGEHWEHFCAWMPPHIGRPVPITKDELHAHALLLLNLSDPERMPQ